MRPSRRAFRLVLLALAITGACTAALAQSASSGQSPAPSASAHRLFLSFAQDAVVVQRQWWEAQLELAEFDPTDQTLVRGVVAFNPLPDIEVGGSVGFGSTDAPAPLSDGSGATDLTLYGKYVFTTGADTDFALGTQITIPTGDDTAGLGFDSFAVELFGSLRHRVNGMTFAGNLGVRLNEDGSIQGFRLDGENSPFVAGAVIYPLATDLTVVGEVRLESERFEQFDSDARVLGGLNWKPWSRGMLRGAVAIGLADGAPDWQLIGGFAYMF